MKNDGGRTALHYAASKGRVNIAEMLLAHGANINAKDKVCYQSHLPVETMEIYATLCFTFLSRTHVNAKAFV